MDYREALESHKRDCRRCRERICEGGQSKNYYCLQYMDIKAYEELLQYQKLGTLEEITESAKTITPKKPGDIVHVRDFQGRLIFKIGDCPGCESGKCNSSVTDTWMYCPVCGQPLDWREEE